MSIIYDALKKVEASGENESKTKINRSTKPKPRIYFLYILAVCLILFIASILYERLSSRHPNITAIIKTLPLAGKKEILPPGLPSGKIATLQERASVDAGIKNEKEIPVLFTLNGVFFSGAEGYALINNRIVKQDDKIEGATVEKISLDEVDLNLGGSIIKLSSSTPNNKK